MKTAARINPYPHTDSLNVADFPRNEYGDVDYHWLVAYATREQFTAYCQANHLPQLTLDISQPVLTTVGSKSA